MLSVRPAGEADAAAIARVHVDSWHSAYPGLLPDTVIASRTVERRLAHWSAVLADPDASPGVTWVLEHEGQVWGFASTGPCRDGDRTGPAEVELYAIYLSPECWGRGWGRTLAEHALRGLPPAATSVSLWVLAGNHRALRFYAGLGFVPDGWQREEALGVPVPEVRLVRDLPYP